MDEVFNGIWCPAARSDRRQADICPQSKQRAILANDWIARSEAQYGYSLGHTYRSFLANDVAVLARWIGVDDEEIVRLRNAAVARSRRKHQHISGLYVEREKESPPRKRRASDLRQDYGIPDIR